MADYIVTMPDGQKLKLSGLPEGVSEQELRSFIEQQVQAGAVPKANPAQSVVDEMSAGERALVGAGKAVSDMGLGIRQLAAPIQDYLSPRKGMSRSEELRQEAAERKRMDAPLMDTTSGMLGNLGGNVAMALLPGGMAMRGGQAATRALGASRAATTATDLGRALMTPSTIGGAASVGAAQGALQPVESGGERLGNMGLGAAGGALVPGAVRGVQVAKSLVDPLSERGQQQIVGRALNRAAGTAEDAALARQNLNAATQPFVGPTPEGEVARTVMGEIVPGSMPTVGQAAGVPSMAALARAASATDPATTNALAQRLVQQNAARVGAIENIAGTGGARDFMEANRRAVGNQLYGAARAQGIDPAALTPEAQANMAAFAQRIPDDVMQRAQDLARINGQPLDNASSLDGLHWIKMAIDDKIATARRAGDSTLANAYQGLQGDLLTGLDNLSPAYGLARREFAAASRPLNEMDTAQAVLDRSVSPLTGNIRPEQFARALSDRTAQTATGFGGATLENTMQPRNLQALRNVQEDLARANFADTAGRGVGSDTVQKLAYSNIMDQSGIPNWAAAGLDRLGGGGLARQLGRVVYSDANADMSRRLAEAMVDPQAAAALMDAAIVNPNLRLALESARRIGGASGVLAPATVNALQAGSYPSQ